MPTVTRRIARTESGAYRIEVPTFAGAFFVFMPWVNPELCLLAREGSESCQDSRRARVLTRTRARAYNHARDLYIICSPAEKNYPRQYAVYIIPLSSPYQINEVWIAETEKIKKMKKMLQAARRIGFFRIFAASITNKQFNKQIQ